MNKTTKQADFEVALKELEGIVEQLEGGDLPLERALELFERGVRLSRECQKRLDEAERKVEILTKGPGSEYEPLPFEELEEADQV
jgi:exodeoxyribonuclease VII small subunit